MLFIMGVSSNSKEINVSQNIICENCGKLGRYNGFMTYNYFSFFFIPLFKWGRDYFVQTSCCQTVYALNSDIGKKISAGENVDIEPFHLKNIAGGYSNQNVNTTTGVKICPNCGGDVPLGSSFCNHCGKEITCS